jgi:Glycosyltransferases involved in cell wall biogenesis
MSEIDIDLPPLEDRPLVTFALFAYNQEKYIREAVEGAFAQTYEPLEIILSDDCSTDRTFEIMEEMVSNYTGIHNIVVLRNRGNQGTLNHVINVCRAARGSLIVVAAGDDISLPHRTEMLIREMDNDAWAISGSYFEINEDGIFIRETINKQDEFISQVGPYSWVQIHGATACYRKALFDIIQSSPQKVFLEDFVISGLLFGLGVKVRVTENPLVFHRIHEENTGIKLSYAIYSSHEEMERKAANLFKLRYEALEYLLSTKIFFGKGKKINDVFKEYSYFNKLKSTWIDAGILGRVRILWNSLKWGELRFALLRLFGLSVYLFYTRTKLH